MFAECGHDLQYVTVVNTREVVGSHHEIRCAGVQHDAVCGVYGSVGFVAVSIEAHGA